MLQASTSTLQCSSRITRTTSKVGRTPLGTTSVSTNASSRLVFSRCSLYLIVYPKTFSCICNSRGVEKQILQKSKIHKADNLSQCLGASALRRPWEGQLLDDRPHVRRRLHRRHHRQVEEEEHHELQVAPCRVQELRSRPPPVLPEVPTRGRLPPGTSGPPSWPAQGTAAPSTAPLPLF